jgi:putative redox protein
MTSTLTLKAVHQGGFRVLLSASGNEVLTDYALTENESLAGMTSLQLLLGALASCSANGLRLLLERDGHPLDSLEVEARAERRDHHPTILDSIHLNFDVSGSDLDPDALERILEIAETRVCPVWVMLRASVPVTRTLRIHP